uniref:Putative secreted protein n=1 Tax=Anopheles darlingi TaxID=43151 RepID=A0A2M4DM22_ANODA
MPADFAEVATAAAVALLIRLLSGTTTACWFISERERYSVVVKLRPDEQQSYRDNFLALLFTYDLTAPKGVFARSRLLAVYTCIAVIAITSRRICMG